MFSNARLPKSFWVEAGNKIFDILAEISAKFLIFFDFSRLFPKFPCFFLLFFGSKNLNKMLLEGFEPTQNG